MGRRYALRKSDTKQGNPEAFGACLYIMISMVVTRFLPFVPGRVVWCGSDPQWKGHSMAFPRVQSSSSLKEGCIIFQFNFSYPLTPVQIQTVLNLPECRNAIDIGFALRRTQVCFPPQEGKSSSFISATIIIIIVSERWWSCCAFWVDYIRLQWEAGSFPWKPTSSLYQNVMQVHDKR